MESNYQQKAGHDINYLALSGILNKFRRVGKSSSPVPPTNMLADFASGSLYCYNLILQALVIKKPMTCIDCSLLHATAYLSQPVLLETIKQSNRDSSKNKNKVSITNFTKPHETVYRDKDGQCFLLKPGTKIYETS